MTEREQEILALLRQDPMIAQQELADRLGISRSALASHISSLIRQGYVQGRGYVLREGPYVVVIGGANMDICGTSHDNLLLGDSNPGKVPHLGRWCWPQYRRESGTARQRYPTADRSR